MSHLFDLPKAEVILPRPPIPLVKEMPVVVDADAEKVDAATGTVTGTSQLVEESGNKSTPATGTAIVGDKAKGTVTFTSAQIQNCSQGTKIKEVSSGLFFFTDAALSFDSPGSKDASVTAEKIGP